MKNQKFTLTEVPVTTAEKKGVLKMPIVLENATASKIMMYLFEKADFYKNVYHVLYTDSKGCGHTFSIGEFDWETKKKDIADKFIAHKQTHDLLFGLQKQ